MLNYLIRRIVYSIPILIGINILTFLLFFVVNSPEDMAHMQLGKKYVTEEAVTNWKKERGYDKPLFFNTQSDTISGYFSDTIFFEKSIKLFILDFGASDQGRDISGDIYQRMWPSLAIALPTFILGLIVNICLSLLVIIFYRTKFDLSLIIGAIVLMSISGLFYIILGQYLFAKIWQWFPVSGYNPGIDFWKFLILPVIIGVVSGIGGGFRWYRTIFLEEIEKDYIKVARSKGMGEVEVLFKHLLKNALLPILTGVVVVIPLLFMGSLITEAFFSIPGLGSYTIDAIYSQDFSIVRTMVFFGSILYIIGLILTDLAYAWADPRIRL
jgi:peptide/nickel transport system permease protein